jgi:hypothetical protein
MAHVMPWLDSSKAKFTKSVVGGMDRRMQDRAGTFTCTLKDVAADEATLRQASTAVPRPRGVRTGR